MVHVCCYCDAQTGLMLLCAQQISSCFALAGVALHLLVGQILY